MAVVEGMITVVCVPSFAALVWVLWSNSYRR